MTPEEVAAYKVDKTGWKDGPWMTEPDRVDFEHAGLACMVIRNHYGNWCGYAGVAPGHPLYGLSYGVADEVAELHVHGGLTYSASCGGTICHVPKPGEPDDVWWFGFDCGHAFDYSPGMDAEMRRLGGGSLYDDDALIPEAMRSVYRDVDYVQQETCELAEQLAKVTPPEQNLLDAALTRANEALERMKNWKQNPSAALAELKAETDKLLGPEPLVDFGPDVGAEVIDGEVIDGGDQ